MTAPKPTPERLQALYAETGSRRDLGLRLGVSDMTAARWLRAAGIALNPVGRSLRSPWRAGLRRTGAKS